MLKTINANGLFRKLSLQTTTQSRLRQASRRPLTKNNLLPPPGNQSFVTPACYRRFAATATTDTAVPKRRPRRRKQKYEKFSEAKLATEMIPTTTSLETPFQYSGDSIEDYKKKAELSPWVPVPDSVARKIFDRAIPEEDECGDKSKEGEVSLSLELKLHDGGKSPASDMTRTCWWKTMYCVVTMFVCSPEFFFSFNLTLYLCSVSIFVINEIRFTLNWDREMAA